MILDTLQTLLECAVDALEEAEVPVCRSFINPGNDAPHDICSAGFNSKGIAIDGQLWVAHLGTTSGWPSPTGIPTTCQAPWTDLIELGIVRCARAKISDSGTAPPAELITEDAENQERDRLLLRQVMMCCSAIDWKNLVVQDWDPISPQGGCVGGVWSFFVRDSGCTCGSLES